MMIRIERWYLSDSREGGIVGDGTSCCTVGHLIMKAPITTAVAAHAETQALPFVPRNCVGSSNSFGVIGDGVEVGPSSIPDAGCGLWTTRAYKKNELVTEYCGTYISHKQALQLRAHKLDSHVRVVCSLHSCIDGIKEPQPGLGGASFCNDARNSKINNAVFTKRHDRKLGSDRVFLQAKRDIPAGSEIFVSYGNAYWRNRGMTPTVVLADQAGAAATDSSTLEQSSDSLDTHASTSSSIGSDHSAASDATVLRRSKRVKRTASAAVA